MKVDYESMSDFEINKAVAIALDVDGDIENITQRESKIKHPKGIALIKFKGYFSLEQFNPCNNPSDAWPIIIENNISINHEIARYKASALVYDVKYERGFNIFVFNSVIGDTSSRAALRAAMIVFLMMNGE